MTATSSTDATPRHLLLATDFSARCDRALDRAAQLTGEWQAELVALNVLAPTAPDQALAWASGENEEQLLHMARKQLARDLAAMPVPATLRIVHGSDAAAAIRDTATAIQADLVITGVSCSEALGRLLLGSTVENLARSLPQPLLVVHDRARQAYRRILVASDFSESSRHALLTTARLFPGRELILYHAYASPLAGLADAPPSPGDGIVAKESECAAFLAASALPAGVKVRPVIEYGPVESTLTRYVREHEIELVALGSHGGSRIMSLLLGSTAAKLLDWLPCDTLLVREPRAKA
ncbi:Usp-like protein [Azotobacter vinelandii CA]|uniref:Usp-like protein n=2 Tax=Azotobacter vinelandii TaxID=354 RepID=C1DGW4_AZOVD|nr:universal stress protein [Azotobacter vinelandii]ACO80610.1 Usp-like protein [Azotobacter vinelandii DJ]AGK14338.1 Usp-like protein [Azotobacter vinelandii CA]AGK22050.1 Usp-like protein [Azotobacter vinelandii CA6]SFX78874.1 Nucleotide-binding universal stress protein, UspA family [Azotobacter vinelandii]GLK58430.1 universal stress protein [Azotobacter vinelandii]